VKTVKPSVKLPNAIVGTVLNGRPTSDVVASITSELEENDSKVYSELLPRRTAAATALHVLTPNEAKSAEVRTLSPAVCIGAETDLVLIGSGRCDARVVNVTTNEVLRVLSTTVVPDTGGTIKVGNKVVVLTPYFFFNGTTKLRPKSLKRFKKSLALARGASTILVTGHSGNMQGVTSWNKALAKNRAATVAKMLKKKKVKAPIAGVGSGPQYPITTSPKRQAANRRVVVVLIP